MCLILETWRYSVADTTRSGLGQTEKEAVGGLESLNSHSTAGFTKEVAWCYHKPFHNNFWYILQKYLIQPFSETNKDAGTYFAQKEGGVGVGYSQGHDA